MGFKIENFVEIGVATLCLVIPPSRARQLAGLFSRKPDAALVICLTQLRRLLPIRCAQVRVHRSTPIWRTLQST